MWRSDIKPLGTNTLQFTLCEKTGTPLSARQAIAAWHEDSAFRSFFGTVLAHVPYKAFFWEMPPMTRDTLDRPCVFVAIDGPRLARVSPKPEAFQEHFDTATPAHRGVVTFPNLGRNATLVVPCPMEGGAPYPHLAAFVRQAPEAQQHALWQNVARALSARLSSKPVWLSTAGMGVHWLHVRLDDRPKYYQHAPFRQLPGGHSI